MKVEHVWKRSDRKGVSYYKQKGIYLLVKVSIQNRQSLFYGLVQKTPTQFIHCCPPTQRRRVHSAACEAQGIKCSLSILLGSKPDAYYIDTSHSSGSPFSTTSSREVHITTLPLHNIPTAWCLTANLWSHEQGYEWDLDVSCGFSLLLVWDMPAPDNPSGWKTTSG